MMEAWVYDYNYRYEDKYWWYVARRRIMLEWIEESMRTRPAGLLLDYGCGTGKLAETLLAAGYHVDAADLSEQALDMCRQRGVDNLINLTTTELANERYDLIILGDVLEHIEDDRAALSDLRSKLRLRGEMLITAPAYQWLWSGEDNVSRHFRRYTLKNLRQVVESAGLAVRRASYYNAFLFPLIAPFVLLRKSLLPRSRTESDIIDLWSPVNTLLTKLFELERFWLRSHRFPAGASIILMAKR